MSNYKYRGRDAKGQLVTGTMEAHSEETVLNYLTRTGVTPISIDNSVSSSAILLRLQHFASGWGKVERAEIVLFARQMYSVTHAGVPLVRGVKSIANSSSNEYFKEVLLDVADKLESGTDFTSALRSHSNVFSHLFISIVHVGESSGSMDTAFMQLADYLEKDLDTAKRIKAAFRYPAFVLIAMAIAVTVINMLVIPAFADLFARFGSQLPLATRVLIAVSDFFVNYWWLLLSVMVISFFAFKDYIETEQGSLKWGKAKLCMPITGDLVCRASMARYARSLALMLGSGVPLIRSLELCAQAVDNAFLALRIRDISSGVSRGESLYQTHCKSGLFTPLVLQMISVGEESGHLDKLLLEVSEFYEREVDYDLRTMSDRIEPIMVLVMAGLVLVLALGIFLPIWSMKDLQ